MSLLRVKYLSFFFILISVFSFLNIIYSYYFNLYLNLNTYYFSFVVSILIGLIGGFLLFPSPDFSKSLLVGIFIPKDLFPSLVSQSLLFLSFIVATFLPLLILKAKKLHIS